jgi:hypothetical protein
VAHAALRGFPIAKWGFLPATLHTFTQVKFRRRYVPSGHVFVGGHVEFARARRESIIGP